MTWEHPGVAEMHQKPAAVSPGTHIRPSQNENPSWEATTFWPHDEIAQAQIAKKGHGE